MTTTDTATKTAKLVFTAPKFALDAILATVPKNPPLLILEGILFEIRPGAVTEGQIEMLRKILDKLTGYAFTAHRPAGYESRNHKLREYHDYTDIKDPMVTFTFTLKRS